MQTARTEEPTAAAASGQETAPQESWQAPEMAEPLEDTDGFPLWLHSGG